MKQQKLRLYTISMKYVRDLHNVDDRVQSVSPQIHKSSRPFVGVVIICNGQRYCIPLDHPKEKHYRMKNDIDFIRIFDGKKLIGVMNLNNMIPVDDIVVQPLNISPAIDDSSAEKAYKNLCVKELYWIRKNQNVIINRANKLYRMIVSGTASQGLKKRCLGFVKLEEVLKKRQRG